MLKKSSNLDELFIVKILAGIFDPLGSGDIDFLSRQIIDGLDPHRIIKRDELDNEQVLAA